MTRIKFSVMGKIVSLMALVICFMGCEDERAYSYRLKIISPEGEEEFSYFGTISEAKVLFYSSEQDFLDKNNPVREMISDASGVVEFPLNGPDPEYWVYVEKGDLNNKKYGTVESGVYEQTRSSTGYLYETILAKTPTKLQIQVLSVGKPVENATVQLYLSEDSYSNNITPETESEEMNHSYKDPEVEYFLQTTDENGVVYFDNLEPRQYWFRVLSEDNEKGNAAGKIKLEEPLPDNEDITTSITVGIN